MNVPADEPPAGSVRRRPAGLVVRWIARSLMILWGAFWLFFAIADGIYDWQQMNSPMALILELLIPLTGLVVLAIAWRWELAGGIFFLVLVALFAVQFKPAWDKPGDMATVFALLVPLLLTGLLLITAWLLNRPQRSQPAGS